MARNRFSPGSTLTHSYTWSTSGLPGGNYTVMVGVFNSSWSTNYYWNGNAGHVTVR